MRANSATSKALDHFSIFSVIQLLMTSGRSPNLRSAMKDLVAGIWLCSFSHTCPATFRIVASCLSFSFADALVWRSFSFSFSLRAFSFSFSVCLSCLLSFFFSFLLFFAFLLFFFLLFFLLFLLLLLELELELELELDFEAALSQIAFLLLPSTGAIVPTASSSLWPRRPS